ncbi:MAG: bifunctional 4-hydroxy-2-oxoglutarate aldolase/2-dehydro-3-deoxy-phosphogluconate aldolase [Clostridia bacterium]|nr:bifunctional 4-hydroxy-2-oxoglutarate aldolase/2-dehydro-3-deoxy-phosphogluconate aldolase [Clostridia bacterium]
MNDILKQIGSFGIVPVIKIEDASKAVPLAKALANGGLPLAEVTFRTAAAADAIKNIVTELPDMLVGAGTVLTTEQVDRAIEAGAKFIVSPGFNPKIVKYCLEKNVPVCPGCATCGEMEQAMELGLDVVKFFPAEAIGGLNVIKSVSAPYSKLKFMPTGGINEKNILSYLENPKILACGGSFMVKDALINEGKFDEIEALTKNAVALMHGFEIVHVGINSENKEEATKTAETLCKLFLLTPDVRSKATFAGTKFEVMHTMFRGKYGHIAISCNFPDRARAYLERLGVEFDESTATYDEKGNLKFVYMKEDIGGFAFHLIKK